MLGTKDETVLFCTAHPEVTTQATQDSQKSIFKVIWFRDKEGERDSTRLYGPSELTK